MALNDVTITRAVQIGRDNAYKCNYRIPCTKQNYLKHSFYYRSIAAWNKLPVDIKSTNQSLSSFKKRTSDIYTHNTLSYVLPTSGVQGDIYVSVNGEGGKVWSRLGGGGGVPLFMDFLLFVWGKMSTETLSCLLLQLEH